MDFIIDYQMYNIGIRLPSTITKQKLNLNLISTYLKNKLINKKIFVGQSFTALYLGKSHQFIIISIDNLTQSYNSQLQNKSHFIFSGESQITLQNQENMTKKLKQQTISNYYSYEVQVNHLKDTITKCLFEKQVLVKNGIGALKGLLISGQAGTGKTSLINQVKRRLKIQQYKIMYEQINCSQLNRTSQFIKQFYSILKENQPTVLILDNAHIIFSQKQISSHQQLLSKLFSHMNSIYLQQIFVIAVCNSNVDLDKSIRSSGRFEKQIKLSLPNHQARFQILSKILEKLSLDSSFTIQEIKKINLRLNGFTIGQIKQIIRQAFIFYGKSFNYDKFDQVVKKYRPNQIKQFIVDVPEVYWTQIGGYQEVKNIIRDVVEFPLRHPDLFQRFGIQPSKGILLYGPPGCSKTMMAKAIATQSKLNFISIKGPELFSKYVGESQKAIRQIFSRARLCSPCIIFFDQIDAIGGSRSQGSDVGDRVLCQLLNEMDGIEGLKEVKVIGATNRPQILDNALMRPGRFDNLIYVGPPDQTARAQILKIYLAKSMRKFDVEQVSAKFAKKTQNYTGAQLALLCRQAVLIGLKRNIGVQCIQNQHLQQALKEVKSRLTKQTIERYLKYKIKA